MKLLVAQLKYQNPMNPTDSNQYMSQMAMFTQVEKLTSLVQGQQATQAWQQKLMAEGLVGRTVTGTASDQTEHTGVVAGVRFGTGEPQLTLADGSTITTSAVTDVKQ